MDIYLHHGSILSTTLIVERIARYLTICRIYYRALTLLPAVQDIQRFWQKILLKGHPLKMALDDDEQIIQSLGDEIVLLRGRLIKATRGLPIKLNIQEVGNIEDFKTDIPNLMEKMNSLDTSLESIASKPNRKLRMDALTDFAILVQRGIEHYKRQVAFGNLKPDEDMDQKL